MILEGKMHKVGDIIHYGNTGVCRVEAVEERKTENGTRLFYCIRPLYQECTIFTPVDNEKVFMRPAISREEAQRLVDIIPTIEAEAYCSSVTRELVEHYEEAINTHSCRDLVELTMSIYKKRKNAAEHRKKFGSVDERFMKKAEDLLFGELAVAFGIDKSDVPEYISKRVSELKNTK